MARKVPKEDKFTRAITRLSGFYYREPKKFWAGVAGVVAIIVILSLILGGRSKENPQASLDFTEALGYYAAGEIQTAEEKFIKLARRYPSDPLGVKAYYYLGNLYYQTQRFEEARDAFERFYNRYRKDSFLAPAGLMGIGNCLENLGNFEGAVKRYEEISKRYKDSPLTPYALMNAGRCYRNLGDMDKAAKIYETLIEKYPEEPVVEEAKFQLAYVRAMKEKF
jgi:TolA-binding protein